MFDHAVLAILESEMHLIRDLTQHKFNVFIIVLGLVAVITAILVTQSFTANYLSRDHNLTPGGIQQLTRYRLWLSVGGISLIIGGLMLAKIKTLGEKLEGLGNYIERLLPLVPQQVAKGVLILIILCFTLVRFLYLNADFPSGITQSGELYTDEGWYAAAAVRYTLTGQWYLAGDLNTALTMPAGQILHQISFSLFGLSLSSARITIVVSFILLTLLTALLIRRSFGDYAAMLTALLLSTNYFGFAYSRLAIMDLLAMFFMIASLFIAGGLKGKSRLLRLLIASVVLGIGILTKTNAVLAIPLLAFLAWRSGTSNKECIKFLFATNLVLLVLVGGYHLVVKIAFPEDYAFFNYATTGFMFKTFHDWEWNLLHKVFIRINNLGASFVEMTGVFTLYALLVSKRYREDPLVHLMIGYIVIYIGMLSLNSYNPPRYYLLLLVPFTGLCATACIASIERLRERRRSIAAIIPVVLIVAVLFHGSWQSIAYLSTPNFSFYQMAHDVENIIQQREGAIRGVLLFGNMTDSISLEIGTNSVNSVLGTRDLVWRLRKYHPKYLIVVKENILDTVSSEGGIITKLRSWDVFGNYLENGEQVQLFSVYWPDTNSQ